MENYVSSKLLQYEAMNLSKEEYSNMSYLFSMMSIAEPDLVEQPISPQLSIRLAMPDLGEGNEMEFFVCADAKSRYATYILDGDDVTDMCMLMDAPFRFETMDTLKFASKLIAWNYVNRATSKGGGAITKPLDEAGNLIEISVCRESFFVSVSKDGETFDFYNGNVKITDFKEFPRLDCTIGHIIEILPAKQSYTSN